MPAQDGDFIATQAGQGDLTPWPHTYTLPIPQDGALDLSGECWGWTGGNLGPLGTFTTGLGRETWDGAPRLAQGSAIEITLAVRFLIPTGTKMTFAERSPDLPSGSFPGFLEEPLPTDPSLPTPSIRGMGEAADHPITMGCNPKCQWLHWTRRPGDWLLKDGPFSIWVTGRAPKGKGFSLDRASRSECSWRLEVTGKVETAARYVYLRAKSVALLRRERDEADEQ